MHRSLASLKKQVPTSTPRAHRTCLSRCQRDDAKWCMVDNCVAWVAKAQVKRGRCAYTFRW